MALPAGVQNGSLEGVLPLFQVAGSSGASLRFGSAHRWGKIRAEVQRRYGWAPEVTSAGDGYRSLARQRELFLRNYTRTNTGYGPAKGYEGDLWWRKTAGTPSAATPGTSNHGEGRTVDVVGVGGLNQFGTARYNQFADVATEHGFSNAEGRSIGEPWHWSDTLNPDDALDGSAPPPAGTTPTEDDMSLTPEQHNRLINVEVAAVAAKDNATAAGDQAYNARVVAVQNQNAIAQVAGIAAETKGLAAETKTDTALLKGGVATIIDLLNGGATAPAPGEPGDPVTPPPAGAVVLAPESLEAVIEGVADAVLARLASIAVTITPTLED